MARVGQVRCPRQRHYRAATAEMPGAELAGKRLAVHPHHLEKAEARTVEAAKLSEPKDPEEQIASGLGLLQVVTRTNPLAEDLAGAPGAMTRRTSLMARLVRAEEPFGPVRAVAGVYDAVLRFPAQQARPGPLLGDAPSPAPVTRYGRPWRRGRTC